MVVDGCPSPLQRSLIVAHEVTNVGNDTAHLANMAEQAKAALVVEKLEVVADRGYFDTDEIVARANAGVTLTLSRRMTSNAKAEGHFGKQDFAYLADEDAYRCPAGEKLTYRYTNIERGQTLRCYWTTVCGDCALKKLCTTGKERRVARSQAEHILEAVQEWLDANPQPMRQRRETFEHPFGTIKARMGATHFQMRTLPRVATEMALAVLAYYPTRVMNIMGAKPLLAAMRV